MKDISNVKLGDKVRLIPEGWIKPKPLSDFWIDILKNNVGTITREGSFTFGAVFNGYDDFDTTLWKDGYGLSWELIE